MNCQLTRKRHYQNDIHPNEKLRVEAAKIMIRLDIAIIDMSSDEFNKEIIDFKNKMEKMKQEHRAILESYFEHEINNILCLLQVDIILETYFTSWLDLLETSMNGIMLEPKHYKYCSTPEKVHELKQMTDAMNLMQAQLDIAKWMIDMQDPSKI